MRPPGVQDGPGAPRTGTDTTCTTETGTDQGNGSATDSSAAPSTVDLGTHALAYVRAGLEVLPLVPGGKAPLGSLVPHGKDDATSDPEQVRDWWVQCPNANIGLRPPEGLVVVDVDPRDGGASNLVILVAEHGQLTPTWTARTGGGGLHVWYRASGPFRGKLRPGVDLKSHNGYVVAPPSMHASGQRYSWGNELPIAVAPLWLAEMVVAPPKAMRTVHAGMLTGEGDDGLVRFVLASQSGERSNSLYWAAMRAAERGTLPAVAARLIDAALAVGLTEQEAASTIASAATRAGVNA